MNKQLRIDQYVFCLVISFLSGMVLFVTCENRDLKRRVAIGHVVVSDEGYFVCNRIRYNFEAVDNELIREIEK